MSGDCSRGKGTTNVLQRCSVICTARWTHNKGGEFYFDATQISALKFALSETRRKLLRDKTAQRKKQKRPLVQELEMVAEKLQQVRKCAEREAIKTSGKAVYDKRRKRWNAFKVWLEDATNQKKEQRQRPQPPDRSGQRATRHCDGQSPTTQVAPLAGSDARSNY